LFLILTFIFVGENYATIVCCLLYTEFVCTVTSRVGHKWNVWSSRWTLGV